MRLAAFVASCVLAVGPAATAEPAVDVCVVNDPRAIELSGLVATPEGYVSVVDSQFDVDTVRIVYLDQSCGVTRTVGYPTPARDPEDIAVAPDGSLWVADIGDNVTAQTRRSTVALWKVPADGPPVIHRLTYPDGPHDAEALLFDGAGRAVIVTKELGGPAGLYRADGAPQPNTAAGVPLTNVGTFQGDGTLGGSTITGAATSPDRHRIALRTYGAAYEWDVPDGDVVKAITTGTPRRTELPGEPQGEAIAYTVDGASFLTLSDQSGPTTLRRYVPSTVAAPAPSLDEPVIDALPQPDGPAWPLWTGIAAVVIGLIALTGGLVLTIRQRRQ